MPEPRIFEFTKFSSLLTPHIPQPWFFKLSVGNKNPLPGKSYPGYSWKHPDARLTTESAAEWMKQGGNIGIAATADDPLVNMDVDGGKIHLSEVKPTLMVCTRSRIGVHAFYLCQHPKIPNIPTDDAGEVRANWQYVVAAGSYVETDPAKVPREERENAGYYTVINPVPPTTITYPELPRIFREVHEKINAAPTRKPSTFNPIMAKKHSAIFDITATDVVNREGGDTHIGKRWPALWHDSDTGINMSLSTNGLIHCWRHSRSFNGLQALTVLSGYMNCMDAGTPHRGAGGGSSLVIGDNGAIFHSWLYAKTHGYIVEDDPIPVKAIYYIAEKHLGFYPEENAILPTEVYRQALKIVEEKY